MAGYSALDISSMVGSCGSYEVYFCDHIDIKIDIRIDIRIRLRRRGKNM